MEIFCFVETILAKVVQCHGSFATASCTDCKLQVPADAIREDIFERRIPLCPRCKDLGEGESKETSLPTEPPSASSDPSISGEASTSSTGLAGGESESDLEVPETSATSATNSEEPSAPSYVPPKAVMKPDIVFFGEGLPDHFHQVDIFLSD